VLNLNKYKNILLTGML